MPDVRVTVDGREVFARDCTDFECEQTAAGQFTASGTFGAIKLDPVPTATLIEGMRGLVLSIIDGDK